MGNGPNTGQAGPGMPDPINALQNLASQGTRNNQMMGMAGAQQGPMGPQNMTPITASNLLQTLNQRPGQTLQGLQGLQGKIHITIIKSVSFKNILQLKNNSKICPNDVFFNLMHTT